MNNYIIKGDCKLMFNVPYTIIFDDLPVRAKEGPYAPDIVQITILSSDDIRAI